MSNVPLPRPGPLGLIQYAGIDMLQYAGEVSAAKDAEIAALRKVLWKIVHLRPDIEHPPLHSEAEGIRILARAALEQKP